MNRSSPLWPAVAVLALLGVVAFAPGTSGAAARRQTALPVAPGSTAPESGCNLKSPGNPNLTTVPWAQTQLQFDKVWSVTEGKDPDDKPVIVAVIDSGFSPHLAGATASGQIADLAKQVLPGRNVVGSSEPADYTLDCGGPDDERGHGTRVSSLIAAPRGQYTFVGVAPEARILPIKAQQDGDVPVRPEAVARGIDYAVAQHATVINISIDFPSLEPGGTETGDDYPVLRTAVRAAAKAGVVIVAAAGNIKQDENPSDGDVVRYPAAYAGQSCCSNVISVGATEQNGTVASYSVTTSHTTVVAPGSNIVALQAGGGYASDSGTSYAAPLVAGVVALMRAAHPGWTPTQIRSQLEYTAQGARGTVPDPAYGYGIVNPVLAVTTPLLQQRPASSTPKGSSLPAPQAVTPKDRGAQHRAVGIAVSLLGLAILVSIAAAVFRRAHHGNA